MNKVIKKYETGVDYNTAIGKIRVVYEDAKGFMLVWIDVIGVIKDFKSPVTLSDYIRKYSKMTNEQMCNDHREVNCCEECCRYKDCKK